MTISASTPARVVVLLTAVVVTLVLLVATGVGAAVVGTAGPGADDSYVTHRVSAGDTLWDIAAAHTDPADDVRRTVFEIRRVNDLDESVIHPGQVLRIPVGG